MNEIYVFGYNGFVGSHFTEQLLSDKKNDANFKINLISRGSKPEQLDILQDEDQRLNFIRSSIEDIPEALFTSANSKVIYYFAAKVDFYAKEEIIARNVEPFQHILNIVPTSELNKIVYISTLGVFDREKKSRACPPLTESSPNFPSSFYGVGKLRSEELLRSSGHRYHIIRLPWCYGSRMKSSHHLIKIQASMNSLNPLYFLSWPGRVSVLSVDDIYSRIERILLTLPCMSDINISDSYAPTFGELFQILGRGIGKQRGKIKIPKWIISVLTTLIPFLPFTARCLFQNGLYTKSEINARLFHNLGDIREFNEKRLGDRLHE
jgi:nucleoside-diphosphate-sugar epimerase